MSAVFIADDLLKGLSMGIRECIENQSLILKAIALVVFRADTRPGGAKELDLVVLKGLLDRAGVKAEANP